MYEDIKVSIRRHGEKDSAGQLSERGIEHAREVAEEIVGQLRGAPEGSVFFIVPSPIGRTKATRASMESVFRDILQGEQDIEVLSIQSRPDWSSLGNKKYIVTDFQPSSLIGYIDTERENTAQRYWDLVKDTLEDDKFAAFKFWCADKKEREMLKADAKATHPNISPQKIDDLNFDGFDFAPEEYALKGYQWLERMCELSKKYLGDRPVRFLGISHDDVSDFLTFELLGYRLNVETLQHFGSMRNFLEESTMKLTEDGLEITYRGETKFVTKDEMRAFPDKIKMEVAERKEWWNERAKTNG